MMRAAMNRFVTPDFLGKGLTLDPRGVGLN